MNMHSKMIEGSRLDFWVAKSAGLKLQTHAPAPDEKHDPESGFWHPDTFHPSVDWTHGGPLLCAEWYAVEDILSEWFSPQWSYVPAFREDPLKWFMRAFVTLQFGEVLEDLEQTDVTPANPGN